MSNRSSTVALKSQRPGLSAEAASWQRHARGYSRTARAGLRRGRRRRRGHRPTQVKALDGDARWQGHDAAHHRRPPDLHAHRVPAGADLERFLEIGFYSSTCSGAILGLRWKRDRIDGWIDFNGVTLYRAGPEAPRSRRFDRHHAAVPRLAADLPLAGRMRMLGEASRPIGSSCFLQGFGGWPPQCYAAGSCRTVPDGHSEPSHANLAWLGFGIWYPKRR